MIGTAMDVLEQYPVRKTRKQKQVFRDAVCTYGQGLGYEVFVEEGMFGSRNVIFGNPETAGILVTAHYDTPARLPFPNVITPCNLPVFLLIQLAQRLGIFSISVVLGVLASFALGETVGSLMGGLCVCTIVGLMLFGPANPSNANDNTSGIVTVLEIMRILPENQRSKVCFVLFDLEEAGMIGSSSYRRAHRKATDTQLVLNLDCVGEGDHLRMFPTKALRKDQKKLTSLYRACGYFGPKDLLVVEKRLFVYPSDQKQFPYGVGICSLKKSKFGLCLGKIHTPRDRVLEITNVNILRSALTTYICCGAELEERKL